MQIHTKKTKLFLDSVIYDEIKKYSWIISGVTTTPTFFNRDKVNFDEFATQLRSDYPDLELHVEALGNNSMETEKELKTILNKPWFSINKVVIKIPVSFDNLKIVSKYSKNGVKFNTHLVFTPCQAYLAVLAGSTYVCPLIGRYADNVSKFFGRNLHGGEDDITNKVLVDILNVVDNGQDKRVGVMASSIRTVGDFCNAVMAGSDIVTVPTNVLEDSIKNEYTDQGILTLLESVNVK
ncbi:hypothetical protein A3C57_00345 [Candidatus Nomurabacteria bacterium RIFCSPHIGHO2_02_FULL_33_12]|uniref:Transaldolase n=1 Tax=Candidatus Nomurabacteria bacterium RIFCSPLOWO2_01_FULL_33_17 TaxID=1801764 RepID=A0A1F6WN29_9BACT|nr:MAG: hypothetical protein A3C57_00345 [Candidatus Nomurabacteria bacterium RIFCSPHIGHO2_02_FULL_33_12]OGI83278.1 MAG: hypothetical protein A2903_02800 [Candidatus Nomurabacteria bacterium RIFCSPLOWO2_01_FULL_33_17]